MNNDKFKLIRVSQIGLDLDVRIINLNPYLTKRIGYQSDPLTVLL